MPQNTKLDFTTPLINDSTGLPVLQPTADELKSCEITQPIPTGFAYVDNPNQVQYQELLEQNRDKLSKYILSSALTQMLDSTQMTSNSNLVLYGQILTDIKNAKKDNQSTIDISKSDLEKFKKIFESKPPQDPRLNKITVFIIECLEQTFLNIVESQNS